MIGYESVCKLITKNPKAHGVHDAPEETGRTVMCRVMSVTRSEYYTAQNAGMKPELILKLSDIAEYQYERELEFENQRWNIIRYYMTNDGGVELTIQRSDVNGG